jgi:two-component system sensor histidine kinase KdpD
MFLEITISALVISLIILFCLLQLPLVFKLRKQTLQLQEQKNYFNAQVEKNQLLQASQDDAAQALKTAERKSDEDRLRTALLSSVSHDLKTPLVTMLGAATSLRDLRSDLSTSDKAELLDLIISESQRLESYIQNLLDMTRLGHGQLSLSRGWVSVAEIYHVVAKRFDRLFPKHLLHFQQVGELNALYVHAALIEQALFNVIDNALKASGADKEILVTASCIEPTMYIHICDHGPGLPASEWQAVFDQFYTFSLGDCYEKGTGLGLSICRSIMRVHGGEACIIAAPDGYRHCVQLSLPAGPTPAQTDQIFIATSSLQ